MQYRILKEAEYEKNKYILPNPGRRFWIESGQELETKRCGFVNDEGVLDKKGAYCSDTSLWLRPVIEFDKGEKRDAVFTEGQQVFMYGLEWTAISEDVLVCDRCVEEIKFDDNTTDFNDSYLKYVLHQYMKRRSAEEAFNPPSAKNEQDTDSDIEIDESEFSYSFLANVICIFLAAAAGIICTLSFSPISISLFAIVVVAMSFIIGKYNISKIKEGIRNTKKKYREKMVEKQNPKMKVKNSGVSVYGLTAGNGNGSTNSSGSGSQNGTSDIKGEFSLDTTGIEDEAIKGKTGEINKLLEAIMKTGNKPAQAKVKFFYIPETQKTLELYKSLSESGIETQNTAECMGIISENLDKTIRLLKIEYDKATDDTVLEARLSSGVIGKMLTDAENQETNKLQLG